MQCVLRLCMSFYSSPNYRDITNAVSYEVALPIQRVLNKLIQMFRVQPSNVLLSEMPKGILESVPQGRMREHSGRRTCVDYTFSSSSTRVLTSHITVIMIGLRAEVRKCEKSYVLHWALVQVKRHLPGIRQSAARRCPDIPFEKIALIVNLTATPIRIFVDAIERVSRSSSLRQTEKPEALYCGELVLRRIERGDKDATMLAIRYSVGQSICTKFYAISLDKSFSTEGTTAGWKSKRQSAVDENDMPLTSTRDEMDDIIDPFLENVRKTGVNLWADGMIEEHVEKLCTVRT